VKTQQEIDALKADWKRDRSWDIEDTPGFEDHADMLRGYRISVEAADAARAAQYRRDMLDSLKRPAHEASQKIDMAVFAPAGFGLARSDLGIVLELVAAMLLPLVERMDSMGEKIESLEAANEALRDKLHEVIMHTSGVMP
jgi:hypothetical protein